MKDEIKSRYYLITSWPNHIFICSHRGVWARCLPIAVVFTQSAENHIGWYLALPGPLMDIERENEFPSCSRILRPDRFWPLVSLWQQPLESDWKPPIRIIFFLFWLKWGQGEKNLVYHSFKFPSTSFGSFRITLVQILYRGLVHR